MGSQSRDQIVDAEPCRVGVSQNARSEGPQPALMLARGMRLGWSGAHKGTHTAFRSDDARAFQLRVDTRDRVGVDAELNRKFSNSRELISRTETARRNRCT
jgi:hypothetical protein